MDITTADQLLDFFRDELQRAWSSALEDAVLLTVSEQPILGSTLSLTIRLPDGVSFKNALEAFPLACRRTFVVHSFWTPNDSTLLMKAGFEILQNARRDKGPQSRAHSFELNETFTSMRRLQTVRIVEDVGSPFRVLFVCNIDELRLQAYVLQFALRMRAQDIELVLDVVRLLKWNLFGLNDYRECLMHANVSQT